MNEINIMLGGHPADTRVSRAVLDAANRCLIGGTLTTEQLRDRSALIPLPVQPANMDKVDEQYRAHSRGSIEQVFGCDWNEGDERMAP